MRLINTNTGQFEEFIDSSTAPLYAILSHTWERPPGREQSYQDVIKIQEKCGLLDEEASSDTHPNNARPPSQILEVLIASEPRMPTQSTQNHMQLPHPSPSTLILFKSLLVGILARISLYFLLGLPIPPPSKPSSEVEPIHPSHTRLSIWDPKSGLSDKVRKACSVARQDGFSHIWIDSSCIDKTSSSELSEAINSMFSWYRDAQICYAFLSDVPSNDNVREKRLDLPPTTNIFRRRIIDMERGEDSKFRQSRWFKRAWTLQELIAPRVVVFLSQEWMGLGTKHSLADVIEEITYIDRDILMHKKAIANESVAERMRWAASREATRVEDEAYSLLGIFGISMTTIYGEGRHAFQRLQEEILQRIPDRTLFAWCNSWGTPNHPIHVWKEANDHINIEDDVSPFATSPKSFSNKGGKINALSQRDFERLQLPIEEYTVTPHGIRTNICLIPMLSLAPNLLIEYTYLRSRRHSRAESWYLILLGSQHASYTSQTPNYLLGKLCYITPAKSGIRLLRVLNRVNTNTTLIWTDFELDTQSLIKEPIPVYLSRPKPSISTRKLAGDKINGPQFATVSFSPWVPCTMPSGYTIGETHLCPSEGCCFWPCNSPSLSLLLSNKDSVNILIQYRSMPYVVHEHDDMLLAKRPPSTFIEARVWISSPDSILDGPPYASAVWPAGEEESTLPIWYIPVPIIQSGKSTWITLRLWLGISKYTNYHAHVEVMKDVPLEIANNDHPRSYIELVASTGHQYTHIKFAVVDGDYSSEAYDKIVSAYADGCTYVYERPRRYITSPYDDAPLRIPEPHPDFKFTMLGSAKRALEAQGYFVHLEAPDRSSPNAVSHSHWSLMISDVNSTFTISIKYFHNRCTHPGNEAPQFIFVACVTLQSFPGHSSSETYQDGPYVLNWEDGYVWSWSSAQSPISLTTPTGDVLSLKLDLDRAWVSEYYLVVDLVQNGDSHSTRGRADGYHASGRQKVPSSLIDLRLIDPHDYISLTLPMQVRRALQAHGYNVCFEGSKNNPYHLILSGAHPTISIEYSHRLSTGSDGRQELTFRACITTSALQNQDASAQSSAQIIEWDARKSMTSYSRPEVDIWEQNGWGWVLPNRDVKLALPNGLEVRLGLSFYLIWLSEYCIVVEVNPPTPLSSTMPHESLGLHGDTQDRTSVVAGRPRAPSGDLA